MAAHFLGREAETTALAYCQRIEQQTAQLAHMADRMLLLSRLDSDEALPIRRWDLNLLARHCVERAQATHSDATLRLEQREAWLPVAADGDLLETALDELIDNALRYGAPGGTVTVRTRMLFHMALLMVHDEGPGIAPKLAPHVCEHFTHADNVHHPGGFGLGLAIVRMIAERHNGRIRLHNRPGAGLTVNLILPSIS
jgi:signal transduction histidine kinase